MGPDFVRCTARLLPVVTFSLCYLGKCGLVHDQALHLEPFFLHLHFFVVFSEASRKQEFFERDGTVEAGVLEGLVARPVVETFMANVLTDVEFRVFMTSEEV